MIRSLSVVFRCFLVFSFSLFSACPPGLLVRDSSVLSGRVVSLKDEVESITMEEVKQGLDVAYYPVRQTEKHQHSSQRTRADNTRCRREA